MPIPTWPASLPPIRGTQTGSGSPGMFPGAWSSTFEGGNDRDRRKFLGRPPTPLQVEFEFDLNMLQIFDDFVEFSINMGTMPFTAPVVLPSGFAVPRTCKFDVSQQNVGPLRWVSGRAPRPTFIVKVWNWRGFEKEVRNLFTTYSSLWWTDAEKVRYNNLIAGLKQERVWDKLNLLHVFATGDSNLSLRNLKAPTTFLGTPSGTPSPAWTANRGYLGDGAQAYLDFGADLSAMANTAVDNQSMYVWSLTDGGLAGAEVGTLSGTNSLLQVRTTANLFRVRANSGVALDTPVTSGVGLFGYSRSGNGVVSSVNGEPVNTFTDAVAYRGGGNITALRSNTVFSSRQIAAMAIGAALTQSEVRGLYTHLRTFLSSVGAVA